LAKKVFKKCESPPCGEEGGPDYPHDSTPWFPRSKRDEIRTPVAQDNVQGIVHQQSGDIHNGVTAQGVASVARDIITVLAYLDVADLLSDTRQKEFNNRLVGIMNVIEEINTTMAEQSQLLQQVAGCIGVIVPAWRNLRESRREAMSLAESIGLAPPNSVSRSRSLLCS
jgi:hypothetical protein